MRFRARLGTPYVFADSILQHSDPVTVSEAEARLARL